MKKYGRAIQATDDNTAHARCVLQRDTQNTYILLLFQGNNSYENAPECHVACLVFR